MDTFRLFHEEDGLTFRHEPRVYFSQSSSNKVISMSELLRLTSDTAVEDYRAQGMSRDMLLEHGYAILVSRCSFRLHRLPRENERVTVTTWEEKSEALQLCRAYDITNDSGELLVTGSSTWLLVDPVGRRIIPTKNFTLRKPVTKQTERDCLKPGKILIPEGMELADERMIRYSDIDGNGHTNNSRYGAFIMDALPEADRKRQFKDFRLNYSKEAMLGQKLQVFLHNNAEAQLITVVGKTESGTSFEAELYY